MLNNQEARSVVSRFIDPIARRLLAVGLTPDAVTYIGAAGTVISALWFFPRGQFIPGVILIAVFAVSDLLDGTMARLSGKAGPWGNYLDSTLDRVADGAVFGAVLIFFAAHGETWPTAAAWVCLVGGFTISYAKARAESVGATANVGIAERAERLIVILAAALITGFGITWVLPVATAVLAVLTLITIAQRFTHVRGQLIRRPPDGAAPATTQGTPPPATRAPAADPSAPTDPGERPDGRATGPGTEPGQGTLPGVDGR